MREDPDMRAACFVLEQVAKQAGYITEVDLEILDDLFYSAAVLAYIKGRQDLQRQPGQRTETINLLQGA